MAREGPAQLEDLLHRERAVVQREENLLVAGSEMTLDGCVWHSQTFGIPCGMTICLKFDLR